MKVLRSEILKKLPPEWHEALLPEIKKRIASSARKIVVLDDDPTGTQTVHDIPVVTHWTEDVLAAELRDKSPAFYILTNSRSLAQEEAERINHEIGEHLDKASRRIDRDFAVVSRSDSTLRGHFPGEVSALERALGTPYDAWLVIPFFEEGGRLTIDDIHYVAEGDWLVPAGTTEYALDPTFGYSASNLKDWVQEKTGGAVLASEVASISLEDLRGEGPKAVFRQLMTLENGRICVVNCAGYRDLEVFVLGLLEAETAGKRFLYRTAASFVQVRAGLSPKSALTRDELGLEGETGALYVVGSYVPRTTEQLKVVQASERTQTIELRVDHLLRNISRQPEITRVAKEANRALGDGRDVVVFTSRQLVAGEDKNTSLSIARTISDGLVSVVKLISVRPRYLLAKGGITSSDVATNGLSVNRAMVLGQILPGVPIWRLGEESRFPGLSYVVFPGNVGDAQALNAIRERLERQG